MFMKMSMQRWYVPANLMKKFEERFLITGQGFASGKLLDGMECQIL